MSILSAVLLYQATNAALYYIIGVGVYFWAFSEGEVSSKLSEFFRTLEYATEMLTIK